MKSIKKLIAAVSAVTIGVTVLAPCAVLAIKESPIAGTETEINFGTNDFEGGANGKPWINKISDTAPIELTEYPEHGKVQCVSYTDDSVKTLQSYLTTFNGYYTPNNGAPYEAKYGKYSISCDIMLSQNNVGYKLVLTDRNTGKGIKDDESEASLRFLATIDFLPNGKIGLYKNGVNSWPILDESQYYSVDYKANQWYRMRIDTDTEKSEVALYIDNNFVGSFNWDEYYKKTYKSYSGLSGLVSNIDIQGGKSNGFVPDEITDVSNIKMYFDNLSMDYIVDGSFYGEAELENNAIKVKLSAEPYNLMSDKIKEITVKKSDGGDVSVGNISVSGSEITVPLNDREGGTEYVITLPSDLSDKNGNIIYSPQIYVSSPITSDDIEYLINDDFEREVYNWVKGGTNNKLPDNAVANAPDYQNVTTAYKKADGTVSDSAESDASKVLKMKKTGTAASGLYFNLPSPAVSDFTIEYDYMTDYIAPLGSNLQMTVNQGKMPSEINANIEPKSVYKDLESNMENSAEQQFAFGFSNGDDGVVKFGAPRYKSLDTTTNRYWSTSRWNGESPYSKAQTDIQANKWYHIKLDYKLTDKDYKTTVIYATVSDGNNNLLNNAEIPTSINLFNPNECGMQIQSIGFFTTSYAGEYEKDKYYPISNYFDNLKVYSYNRSDNRVKTVTFKDINGEEFGALQTVSDTIKSATVELSAVKGVVSNTINKDSVKVLDEKGKAVDFKIGEYNAESKTFDITFDKFLEGGKTYTVIADGIYCKNAEKVWSNSKSGSYLKIPRYAAKVFVTDKNTPKVTANLRFVDANGKTIDNIKNVDTVYLAATIVNTTESSASVLPIISKYDGDRQTDIVIKDALSVKSGNYIEYKSDAIDVSDVGQKIGAFLWNGTDSIMPYGTAAYATK